MEVDHLPDFLLAYFFLLFKLFLQDIDHFIGQSIENDFLDIVIFFVETSFENVFDAPFVDFGFEFMVDFFSFDEIMFEIVMGIVNGHDDVYFEKFDSYELRPDLNLMG